MATRGDIIDPILAEEDAKLSAFVLATVGMISFVNEYATEKANPEVQVPSTAQTVIPMDPDDNVVDIERNMPVESKVEVRTNFRPNLQKFSFYDFMSHSCLPSKDILLIFHKRFNKAKCSGNNARN